MEDYRAIPLSDPIHACSLEVKFSSSNISTSPSECVVLSYNISEDKFQLTPEHAAFDAELDGAFKEMIENDKFKGAAG